mgnify:CR=1 FL=1
MHELTVYQMTYDIFPAYRLFDIKHPRAVPPVFIVYDQCQDIRPFTAMILYKGRFVFVSIDSVLTVVNMKIGT